VKSSGGQTHGVYGKGKVKLSSTSRKTNTINDVLYVPNFMTQGLFDWKIKPRTNHFDIWSI
jgi:hypothetical protein